MASQGKLSGKKVAILVEEGFEQVEMTEPRKALEDAGAGTDLVSPCPSQVRAFRHDKPGDAFPVDVALDQAAADDYDALVLPGGVMNPDRLRINPQAVAIVERSLGSSPTSSSSCPRASTPVTVSA